MAKSPQIGIDISARDQFSGTIARLRQQLDSINKPLRDLDQRFGKPMVPDFGPIGKAYDAFHLKAQGTIRGGLSGLGPSFGFLGGAATVAGIAEMTRSFGDYGVSLRNAAQIGGTTVKGMDSLRGAAILVGSSAQMADTMMASLNQTLGAATYGRDSQAVAVFQQLGIAFGDAATGARRAEDVLPALSNSIKDLAKSDPRAALRALEGLHLSPENLQLLGLGADRMRDLREEASRLSGVTDGNVASAEKFAASWGRLTIAGTSLRNEIVTGLEPALTPLMSRLAGWVASNHTGVEDTVTGIARAIGKAGDAVTRTKSDLDWFFDKVRDAGKAVGADKLASILAPPADRQDRLRERFDGLTGAPDAAPSGPNFLQRLWSGITGRRNAVWDQNHANPAAGLPVDKQSAARDSFNFWRSKGFTKEGAASMAAQEMGESGGDVAARGDGGRSHGLYQHGAARRAAILKETGIDLSTETDPNKQREAVYQEMKKRLDAGAGRAYDKVSGTNDLQAGVEAGVRDFERSGDQAGDIAKRLRIARDILRQNGPEAKPEEPDPTRGGRLPPLVQPSAPVVALPSSAGSNNGNSRVSVDLNFNGAPDGMRHAATTQGNGVEMGSVRIKKAMPTSGGAAP